MKNARSVLAIVATAFLAVFLSGCAGLQPITDAEISSQGNARYKIVCPVILPDGKVATYRDENGKVMVAMAEAEAVSGRSLGGDALVDAPGCIKIEISGGAVQGEARTSVVGGIGQIVAGFWTGLFGGP